MAEFRVGDRVRVKDPRDIGIPHEAPYFARISVRYHDGLFRAVAEPGQGGWPSDLDEKHAWSMDANDVEPAPLAPPKVQSAREKNEADRAHAAWLLTVAVGDRVEAYEASRGIGGTWWSAIVRGRSIDLAAGSTRLTVAYEYEGKWSTLEIPGRGNEVRPSPGPLVAGQRVEVPHPSDRRAWLPGRVQGTLGDEAVIEYTEPGAGREWGATLRCGLYPHPIDVRRVAEPYMLTVAVPPNKTITVVQTLGADRDVKPENVPLGIPEADREPTEFSKRVDDAVAQLLRERESKAADEAFRRGLVAHDVVRESRGFEPEPIVIEATERAWPHRCARCGSPAYHGLVGALCSRGAECGKPAPELVPDVVEEVPVRRARRNGAGVPRGHDGTGERCHVARGLQIEAAHPTRDGAIEAWRSLVAALPSEKLVELAAVEMIGVATAAFARFDYAAGALAIARGAALTAIVEARKAGT